MNTLVKLVAIASVMVPVGLASAWTASRHDSSRRHWAVRADRSEHRGHRHNRDMSCCKRARRHVSGTVVTVRSHSRPRARVVREVVYRTRTIGNDRFSISISRPVVQYRAVVDRDYVERPVIYDRHNTRRGHHVRLLDTRADHRHQYDRSRHHRYHERRIRTDSRRGYDRDGDTCRKTYRSYDKCKKHHKHNKKCKNTKPVRVRLAFRN